MSWFETFCRFSARLLPVQAYRLKEETRRELELASFKVSDGQYASGLLCSLLVPLLVVLAISVLLGNPWLLLAGLLILCLPCLLLFMLYPSFVASQRRSEARGYAVGTLLVLIFDLMYRRNLRGAMARASRTPGMLAEDLRRAMIELERGEGGSPEELMLRISHKWSELDEGIGEVLEEVSRGEWSRRELLQTSRRLIAGVEREVEEELQRMVSPALYFLSLGALAVLLTVGLSPLFALLGRFDLSFYPVISVALALLFWLSTIFLLTRRPLTLPFPPVQPLSPAAGLVPASFSLLPWLWIFGLSLPTVFGIGLSIFLFGILRSWKGIRLKRERVKRVEQWRRAVDFLGQRLGRTGLLFSLSETIQRFPYISKPVRELLLRIQEGSADLSALPERVEDPISAQMLEASLVLKPMSEEATSLALREAGQLLEELQKAERRFRHRMGEIRSNLWMLSLVLIPLVCSLSAWMISTFAELSALESMPFLSMGLGPADLSCLWFNLGLLSLVLSLAVARYASGLQAPGDRVQSLFDLSITALVSASVFLFSSWIFQLLAP